MNRVIGLALWLALAAPAFAQEGGQVREGEAVISEPDPSTTRIDQFSDKVVLEWTRFDVPSGKVVRFQQPRAESIALNRVVGGDPSRILGTLAANGRVFLVNRNGILIGEGARVNTGAFIASTLSLGDRDFLEGNYRFVQDPDAPLSYVVNRGDLSAREFVVLAAPFVENSGAVDVPQGQVYLLAGREVILDLTGDGLIGYSLGAGERGTVRISGEALSDLARKVVNSDAFIEAGEIVPLSGGGFDLVAAEGTLVNDGTITTRGAAGVPGGRIVLDSAQATMTSYRSLFDASGVGENSDGGTVRILSDRNAYFNGKALALGGTSGDGGLIELSALGNVYWRGLPDASATDGAPGLFHLDPDVISIIAGGPGPDDGQLADSQILAGDGGSGTTFTVSENRLQTLPAATSILLEAAGTGTPTIAGITMADLPDNKLSLPVTSGNSVTLRVTGLGDIEWDASDTIETAGASLLIESGDDIGIAGTNAPSPAGSVSTNGGTVTIRTLGSVSPRGFINITDVNSGGANVTIEASESITVRNITATGSRITITADTNFTNVGFVRQAAGGMWTANELVVKAADGIKRPNDTAIETTVNRAQFGNVGNVNGLSLSPPAWPSDRILVKNTGPLTLTDLTGAGYAVRNMADPAIINIPSSTEIEASGTITLAGNIVNVSSTAPIIIKSTGGAILDDGVQTTEVTGEALVVPGFGTTGGLPDITLDTSGGGGSIGSGSLTSTAGYIDVGRFGTLTVTAGGPDAFVSRTSGGAITTSTDVPVFSTAGTGTAALINLDTSMDVDSGLFSGIDDNVILGAATDLAVSGSVTPTGSTITMWAGKDVTITSPSISSTTRIEIQADSSIPGASDGAGAISKTGGGTMTTADLVTSSGSGTSLDTFDVTRWQATNTTSGDITGTDSATLDLADIDGLGYAVSNTGSGAITISTTTGDLTLSGDVMTGSGTITLTADGSILDDSVQTTEISTTGTIALTATTGSIGSNSSTDPYVDVAPGFASLTATAAADIYISQVGSGTLQTSDVTLTTSGTAATLGLANLGGDLNVNDPTFDLGADDETIKLTASRDVLLNADISTTGGAVEITAGRNIVDDGLQTTEITTTGAVTLAATGGSIGADTTIDRYVDVTAGFSSFSATAGGNVFVEILGAPALLTSTISTFTSTGTDKILALANRGGDLTVDSPLFGAGDDSIRLASSGTVTVSSPMATTGSEIRIDAAADVSVGAGMTAATGRISLTADSALFTQDGTGAVTQTAGTITADEFVSSSASGTTIPDLAAAKLDAANSTSGDISITNTGPLRLRDLTGDGNAMENAGGAIAVTETGTLTVEAPVRATSDVTMTATGDVEQPGTDTAAEIRAGGAVTIDAGTEIRLGRVTAGTDVTITAGPSDSILDANDIVVPGLTVPYLNIRAGGNATLTAGGSIGTASNCIELDVDGTVTTSGPGGVFLCAGAAASLPLMPELFFRPHEDGRGTTFIHEEVDPILQRLIHDPVIWPPRGLVRDERERKKRRLRFKTGSELAR